MRCPKEFFIKGEYFHIYNRTIFPYKLFNEENDYRWFQKKFEEKMKIYPATVIAYCLMPNHFHFLIRQESDKPIYRIFNDTLSSYVRHYNFKYKRRGSLFEGHLQHVHIKENSYFAYLCQYIHYNPKKANLVELLEDWEYSNYLEWIGKGNNKMFDLKVLKNYFNSFKDYKINIMEHEKYVNEQQFRGLLID